MSPSGSLFEEYQWRGMVFDATPGLSELMAKEFMTGYIGFDPTASSLHIGSLLPIMCLARMQRFGHSPIAIAGGGTGMIGDPSGKTKERQLLNAEQVEENLAGIRSQLEPLLDFETKTNPARIVNNLDWLGQLGLIEFLRDTGKHFTVNYMMAKESVKRRLASDDGISYTEFTYMMLQAYDFLKLNETLGCNLQMGGSDQWGNILAGADLIRRVRGEKAHGLVFPLVTNAAGTKFGKTESGTVWLAPDRTSPYRFYQFWLNTDDADAINYLKYFTWLDRGQIEELAVELEERPGGRAAQRRLASEVTDMVHGPSALAGAEKASSVLFGGAMEELSAKELMDVFEEAPSSEFARDAFSGEGMGFLDLLADTGLAASKGEARRLVRSGGIYMNNNRVSDEGFAVRAEDCIDGVLLVLRKGKKNFRLVQLR
ncbi:MAG: tyrosyl-tRNA synthetase [Rhodothermales bacterium]|jgi:tyrosyl-tRNA synthetase